jgi:predicted permease
VLYRIFDQLRFEGLMAGAGVWWLRVMGRLKEGATAEQARAGLEPIFQQSALDHRGARVARGENALKPLGPDDYPRLIAYPGGRGETSRREDYQKPLYILLGVVGLVLLIACANVANLLLARAAARQKEIAVRLALGAGRGRLVRQLLTESVLLATVGGALGVLFAYWIKDGLLAVGDWGGAGMTALEPSLDLRVLGFAFALSLLTGLLFGTVPAWRATRVDLTPALKDSARSSSAASRSLFTRALVAAQVAISLLLMVGAGLFVRTLVNLQRAEVGFDERNLLLFTVEPGLIGYKGERLANLYKQMAERVENVPGVRSVTFSAEPPLARSSSDRNLYLPGAPVSPDGRAQSSGVVYFHQVRENFLKTMGIPVLSGRDLTPQDGPAPPRSPSSTWPSHAASSAGRTPWGSGSVSTTARPAPATSRSWASRATRSTPTNATIPRRRLTCRGRRSRTHSAPRPSRCVRRALPLPTPTPSDGR